MNNICFFGLLHINHNENQKLNFQPSDKNFKVLTYLKNAILLQKQLKRAGFKLVILTNKKKYLEKLLEEINSDLNLKNLNFNTYVPKNTHFYSCHFRVDVFKYLSKLKKTFSILVDLDILVLGELSVFKKLESSDAYVNDITDNVIPAYGKKKILNNLRILNKNIKTFKWYGGDFFAGNYKFFSILYRKTFFYQKKFVENSLIFKNQTDELFISAALNDIKLKKLYNFQSSERKFLFTRFWNTNVKHKQKKILFYKKFKLLHVPADKVFLSKCFNFYEGKTFLKEEYFKHVYSPYIVIKKKISKFIPQKIKNFIKNGKK